ncbi:MAG: hypothetical protein IJ911_11280 [Salinivirgaceae bacterium]|nr:hypothetical protein [Salinivirgaceae bacterium]
MREVITLTDALIVPLYLMILWWIASSVRRNHIDAEPCYRYFTVGLMLKIFAGIAFALIYTYHYGETDTHYYYWGTQSIERLAHKDFGAFAKVMAGVHTPEVHSAFDRTTGWPTYWRDPNSFAVCRFNVPLYLLGAKTFLGNIIVLNALLFIGFWKFYKLMLKLFPNNDRNFAIALLFVPSVVFWGSSLLKDSWCLVASMFVFCAVHSLLISRKRIFINVILLIICSYICMSIRPYSFFTTIGACIVWIGFVYVYRMRSRMFRVLFFPIIVTVMWLVGVGLFSRLGSLANERYQSLDAIIETAVIIQDDLKKEYYGGNSFDIGAFEPTIGGLVSKAPAAIVAGVFRPFVWESRNVLMFISGLETLGLMLLIIFLLFKFGLRRIFSVVMRNPFLISASVFVVTYAFFVGLTTANFGALVRYRMPVIVFLALILAVVWRYMQLSRLLTESNKETE